VIGFASECFAVSLHGGGATCVRVVVAVGGERASFLSVYRSPSGDLGLFIDDLDNRCRWTTHWLVSDVNCNILPGSTEPLAQRLFYTELAGFISCIDIPTRVTANTSSCIDHIFTDTKLEDLLESAVIKSELTDHYLYSLPINFTLSY